MRGSLAPQNTTNWVGEKHHKGAQAPDAKGRPSPADGHVPEPRRWLWSNNSEMDIATATNSLAPVTACKDVNAFLAREFDRKAMDVAFSPRYTSVEEIEEESTVGILDKARSQMDQVKSVVQDGLAQGQGKLDQIQTQRQLADLYRALGQAYYAKERQGGTSGDVTDVLTKIDAFLAANPPNTSATDPSGTPDTEENPGRSTD